MGDAAKRHDLAGPSGDAPSAPGADGLARPRGLRWRLTAGLTERSRRRRYDLFHDLLRPSPDDTLLDVGVTDSPWRSGNFLEAHYPWPGRITAVALEDMPTFRRHHPEVTFVRADGRQLPFADEAFDIGFSNAVVEHVGDREAQSRFVTEIARTCRRFFISTPNRRFPIDPHTLLPVVHWFDQPRRGQLYRALRQPRWADDGMLNPLDRRAFAALFPPSCGVRIVEQRLAGLTTVLVAIRS